MNTFNKGKLSLCQNKGPTTPLPSKRDKIADVCPVTLVDVTFKIGTEAFANMLPKVHPEIVSPNLTDYVRDWHINKNQCQTCNFIQCTIMIKNKWSDNLPRL